VRARTRPSECSRAEGGRASAGRRVERAEHRDGSVRPEIEPPATRAIPRPAAGRANATQTPSAGTMTTREAPRPLCASYPPSAVVYLGVEVVSAMQPSSSSTPSSSDSPRRPRRGLGPLLALGSFALGATGCLPSFPTSTSSLIRRCSSSVAAPVSRCTAPAGPSTPTWSSHSVRRDRLPQGRHRERAPPRGRRRVRWHRRGRIPGDANAALIGAKSRSARLDRSWRGTSCPPAAIVARRGR
jgi:hypothetical protein